jgi:hypothetical protein
MSGPSVVVFLLGHELLNDDPRAVGQQPDQAGVGLLHGAIAAHAGEMDLLSPAGTSAQDTV